MKTNESVIVPAEGGNDKPVRKVLTHVLLGGFLCPVYERPDEDVAKEWSDQ